MCASAVIRRAGSVFGLDVRSLAAFRIAVGGILLADLAVRAGDFAAMYGPDGLAPANMARGLLYDGQWSLHVLADSAAFQAGMLVAAAISAALLTVGYRTRLATIVCWALTASLHARLPAVINAGDTLLRVLLFWSMFLPLGAAWSADARRRGPRERASVFSMATVGLIVQVAIVYWLAGLAKWNDQWLHENALGGILGFGLYGKPLGRELQAYPALTAWASTAVVWLELLGPLLLFIPWRTAWFRLIAIAAFALFHAGIALTITLGLFSYVAIAAWLALVPSEFWEWVGARLRSKAAASERVGIPPLAPSFEGGGFATAFCAVGLAIVVYWNVVNVTDVRLPAPAHSLAMRAGNATALRQVWAVFGYAPSHDCWFAYEARLKNGELVNLLTGRGARPYERPALASREFKNHRWRKLHWRLTQRLGRPYRESTAEWFVRQWNQSHGPDEQVVQLDFYCYRQALERGQPTDAYTRESLARITLGAEGGAFADAVRELDL